MCAGRAGAVPGKNGFQESSGNRTGNRLGSRFQESVPRFQGLDRFQETGSRISSRAGGAGSKVWVGSRAASFQGSEVPGTGSRFG